MNTRPHLLRRTLASGGLIFVLGMSVYAGTSVLGMSGWISDAAQGFARTFHEASTQWMIVLAASICVVSLSVLYSRPMFWCFGNPHLWLVWLVAITTTNYFLHFQFSSGSTHVITLLSGAVLGYIVVSLTEFARDDVPLRRPLTILSMLIVGAIILKADVATPFNYRGTTRNMGAWNNPNTFGAIVGGGIILTIGLLIHTICSGGKMARRWAFLEGVDGRLCNNQWRVRTALLAVSAAMMLFGLLTSFSRGAWAATLVGLIILLSPIIAESRTLRSLFNSGIRRQWLLLSVIVSAFGVLGFFKARYFDHDIIRRVVSIANANDFSTRNRIAAYQGALQMVSDKFWTGFGWNQPEPTYNQLYRMRKVDDGMAIQMNDYFMIATTLGMPALFILINSVVLASPLSGSNPNGTRLLRNTCWAGASVLLVSFFFDGGLFKLPTAAMFWILLSLARISGPFK